MSDIVRIVCISDTHEQHRAITKLIPECDLLIHAGDITGKGSFEKVHDFNLWCEELLDNGVVKSEVIAIAGNHDITAQTQPERFERLLSNVTYLRDNSVEACGLKIYGSPWTPSFFRMHWVFNADRGAEIRAHWDSIPEDLDILITHGPPFGVCDKNTEGEHVGCADLRNAILRKRPKLHICGHIHEGYGSGWLGNTEVLNVCTCTRAYRPTNHPVYVEIDRRTGPTLSIMSEERK